MLTVRDGHYFLNNRAALRRLVPEDLDPEEQELLTHFHRIWNSELRTVAIAQLRALAGHDTEQTLAREAAYRDKLKSAN